MKKRSNAARIGLLGISALAMGGCDDRDTAVTFFDDVESCTASAERLGLTTEDCERGFAEAMTEHASHAPRYEDLALCEELHGTDACAPAEEADAVAGGSGSFMPFIAGYLIGNSLANRGANSATIASRPLYSTQSGSMAFSNGANAGPMASGQMGRTSASAMTAPRGPAVSAPLTRAEVTQRGGFGAFRSGGMGSAGS